MRMQALSSLFLLGCLAMAGCGPSQLPAESVTPVAPPAAKAQLMDVANSGELGSAASAIRESLEAMKATDSAKADELLNDLTALEGLGDPAQIKAKAKAMADKL
ncbi:MAG: hypothetical protein RLZZ436_4273 [Planctomycetota bacterium]